MKFVSIGYGNVIAAERIVTLVSPDSAPVKRLIQDAKENGRAIDASAGKKTRAVIITDSEHVVLSALTVEVITKRLNASGDDSAENTAESDVSDNNIGTENDIGEEETQ